MRPRWQYLLFILLCLARPALSASVHTALGIDVDFYTGPISPNVWKRVKAADQKFVIAQAWGGRSRNEYAVSQLAGARAVGLKTAAYVLLNYDDQVCPTFAHPVRNEHGRCMGDPIPQEEPGGGWQVRQGLAALGTELDKVSFIAIDVEWFASPAPSLDAAEQERRRQSILDAIGEVKRLRKQPVIYTRNARGHWSDITGCSMTDSTAGCADLYRLIHNPAAPIALWDVQDGMPELNNFRPHGAWTERLGRQYKLDTNLFGLPETRTVDLNVFDLSLFTPRGTPPRRAKKPSRKGRAAARSSGRRNS